MGQTPSGPADGRSGHVGCPPDCYRLMRSKIVMCHKGLMHCTNFGKNAGTHLHDTHRAVEEPSTASMAEIANSLSVPPANAFHMAKQSHQIRNLNVFERMHGIFDLAARPFVGVTGRESVELD